MHNDPNIPWLSIGVPTFNRRKLLEKLVDSVDRAWREAGWPAWALEMIVVDNASTDDTWEFLQQRQETAGYKLRVLRNSSNIGILWNFVRAMEETTGEYLMVFGDDDELEPHGLKVIREKTLAYPRVASFCFWSRDHDSSNWVDTDTRMSLEQVAARYFYYPGNCGLAAMKGPLARQALKEMQNQGRHPTTWIIMEIFGITARSSGEPDPILLSPEPVACYPVRQAKTLILSHYAFSATWLGQTRCAQVIDIVSGSRIAPLVSRYQLWGINGLKKLGTIFVHSHFLFDLEADRQETISEAIEAFRKMPAWGKPFCAGVALLLALPMWLKKSLLWTAAVCRYGFGGPARYRILKGRRKAALALREQKSEEGDATGVYTRASW